MKQQFTPPDKNLTILVLCTLAALTSCADPGDADSDAQLTTRQQTMFWESEEYPFPTLPSQIVPPHLPGPLHACAQSVVVTGVVEDSPVAVFDVDTGNPIGEGIAGIGSATVTLQNPLTVGQRIQAKQVVDGQLSPASNIQTVIEYQGALPTPRLDEGIWECGRGVQVYGGLSGATMQLTRYDNNVNVGLYGQRLAASDGVMVLITGNIPTAHIADELTAHQSLCSNDSAASNRKPIVAAPNPMPVPQITSAVVGSRFVELANMVAAGSLLGVSPSIGSSVTFISNDEKQKVPLNSPLAANATLTATQTLCNISSPSLSFTPAPASQLLTLIGTPSLLEPICPGARYVTARANVGEGYLVLDNDTVSTNGYISLVSALAGETVIGIPSGTSLTSGQQLRVRHILPTASSPYSAPVTVAAGARFSVEGGVTLTDQNIGAPVTGFVSETSRGPRFVFQECCDANAATSFTGQVIDGKGDVYATVTFYQQFSGKYEAQWDWFVPSSNPAKPTPPTAGDYLINFQTPCSNASESVPFKVFRSTVDTNDTSVPNEVTLSISGSPVNVTDTSGNQNISIPSGQTHTLTATATDFNGIQRVELIPTPASLLPGTLFKQANAQAPVPSTLTHSVTLPAMLPTQQLVVKVRGTNFRTSTPNSKDTATLTITAAQAAPAITGVVTSPTFTNNGVGGMLTVRLNGNNLYYSTLPTVITFEAVDGTTHTATSFNAATSTETALRDVLLPAGLIGKGGATKVRVQVGTLTSAAFTFELLDRPAGFTRIKLEDLKKPGPGNPTMTPHECKDNGQTITATTHPNAVKFVEIYRNSAGSSVTHNVRFKRVDGTYAANTDIGLSLHPNTNIGGVSISNDCRLFAVLRYNGGTPPILDSYLVTFSYFRADGQTHSYPYGAASPYYVVNGTPGLQGDGRYWNVFVSKDGSVAVLTHASALATTQGSNIPVVSKILDFKYLNPATSSWGITGNCPTSNLCNFGATLTQGRSVKVSLDSNASFQSRLLAQ